jgi:AcrR family transcriptional regulator
MEESMARTGGDKTKKKILTVAEKIFSAKGYDGTSIQDISSAAGVNKALIYYHFKNKQDIIDSLFEQTLHEMFDLLGTPAEQIDQSIHSAGAQERVNEIVSFLEKRKKILSVMLMESLKNEKSGHISLFKCADMIISRNVDEMLHLLKEKSNSDVTREELLIHEFFTGFLPIVFFALFKDKWADYFKCERNQMIDLFVKVFKKSHMRHE